jgi:ribose transport system permease protein
MTLVILTGGIDLSVGSILATTAVIGLMTSLNPALQWGTIIIPIIAGLIIGLINGVLVAYVGLPPFIATLGTMTTFRGVSYLLPDGTTIINNDLNFAWIGNNYLGPIPWLVVIAFFIVVLAWFLLRKTVLGVRIYAVGGNAQAARLTGIKVGFVLVFVYAVSGLLCGLGGVMTASRLYSASGLLGNGYELDAIAAVILGGTSVVGGIGGVSGTLVGALIMAVLNNGLTLMNVSFFWQMVIRGIVIILAVTIDKFRFKSST